ncbi:MAG: hypothetical protein L0226_04490 [Acidobacteria bacterium]|nr:hypothetical protein [Acidobacteriota bacterium]
MKPIRAFTKDDIPQVVDMFRRLLLDEDPSRRALPMTVLPEYFEQIFFHNPWYDDTLPSLVYQAESGKIIGFLGVVQRPMTLGDRPIRVAISFHFMVEPESRSSMAGVKLLKAFFSGPQDLSLTDGSGDKGRRVWEGVGGTTALLYSQRWIRILRPTQEAVNLLSKHSWLGKYKVLSPITQTLSALSGIADSAVMGVLPNYFPTLDSDNLEEELDIETFLTHLPDFSKTEALRPVYDKYSLSWLLEQAAQIKLYGSFKKVLVRNARCEVIGWYIYYLNPGELSWVLQFAARKESVSVILDHLFCHARLHGAVAVTGRLYPRYMQELSDKHCFFSRIGGWVLIHSNDNELIHVIQRGDAFLTGLEGEWCLLF